MELTSTRNPRLRVTFKEAVERNLPAPHAPEDIGGLYVPATLAPFPDVQELLALAWPERCAEILHRLLAPEYTRAELAKMVGEAFDFPVPLVPLPAAGGPAAPRFALELFHGPSLAFKDFGARFLAAVLARLPGGVGAGRGGAAGGPRTILTATSGDTGAAVAAAFSGRPGFRAVVVYPEGRVSPLQERQLACLGGNVLALAVAGTFDDCQRLVKACFADPALAAGLRLTSANSINIARLLAQVLYYFEAAARLRRLAPDAPPPVVAVPSGNFGNLCAGLWARALGLPLAGLVAATNANRTVPDYLDSGRWRPRPAQPTASNAMDVGDPSNWERIVHLHRGDWESLRRALRWGSLDERETADVLRRLWARSYQADPHAAVACGVLARARGAARPPAPPRAAAGRRGGPARLLARVKPETAPGAGA